MSRKHTIALSSITALLLMLCLIPYGYAQHANQLHYVNPFIGTAKSNVLTKWGSEGGTYPGAVAPAGAIQLSPETRVNGAPGYNYKDSSICYFSCFGHFSGFPGGSSGRFFIMPVNAEQQFEPGNYNRRFLHRNEVASPGYYKVVFDDNHTIAEATASTRTGIFRLTFPANIVPVIFIGDAGEIKQPSKRILHAANGLVVINFSEDFAEKKQVKGGWIYTFKSSAQHSSQIILKLSRSSTSFENARNNIDKEIGSRDFDEVRKQTSEEWGKKLSVVNITDKNEQNKTVFYTALYHSLLIPWVIDDADGSYMGYDGKVHQKTGKNQYGGFSPWDTFRSLNPLLTLLYPDKEKDVILSMLDVYKQTGHLPTESMTGNHAIPIIVDSYLKGIRGFDETLAYKAMKSNIIDTPFVQSDMKIYQQDGYIPFTNAESVTRTVEYAYDDWALAQFAGQVVNDNKEYSLLMDRSYSYRNLLNPDELFLLPRNKKEFKLQPGMSGYKEGDKWVYTYFVPQNTRDLVNLLGGDDKFAGRLDSALVNNVILFDNETVFHLPYLFNQAGNPALTQKWCRQIMLKRFSNTPGGLPGNDDLGSTSSWYVFSSMGIYPVCPGRPLYAIGSPLFQSVTLNLPNGRKFVINAKDQSAKNSYVQALNVNGRTWQQLTVPHDLLIKGGEMNFTLSNRPGKSSVNKAPVELSETKTAARFQILKFSVSKSIVEPDEPFTVHFSIANNGSAGTKIVKLLVNGTPYAFKNSLVASGETIRDSIRCRLYPLGKTTVSIEGTAPVIITVTGPHMQAVYPFKITELRAIPVVKLNDTQQIAYSVQNITGIGQVCQIPVCINDTTIFTDTIALTPGEKTMIKHVIKARRKGFQRISINDAQAKYKVYQNELESLLLDMPEADTVSAKMVSDRSGFGNNGCIMPPGISHIGAKNNELMFGENCFVEVPNAASLDLMGNTITMMAWVYPTGDDNGLVDIFTKGDSHVLQVKDGKTLTFFAGGWGRGDCTADLPSDWKNHWHHIAGVCTGNTLFLYIDGILKSTTVMEDVVDLSNNNKWTFGRNEEFPSQRIYHGYIDGIKIYKQPLSQEDILKVFTDLRRHE